MRSKRLLPALMVLLSLTFISCGKKGDPFLPPPQGDDLRVTGLRGDWNGEFVLLSGRMREPMSEGAGLRVYYAAYPLDQAPCEGCPIQYQGFQLFGHDVIEENGFSCRITEIRPGNVYFFEVRVLGSGGGIGPPSNRVQVEVP